MTLLSETQYVVQNTKEFDEKFDPTRAELLDALEAVPDSEASIVSRLNDITGRDDIEAVDQFMKQELIVGLAEPELETVGKEVIYEVLDQREIDYVALESLGTQPIIGVAILELPEGR